MIRSRNRLLVMVYSRWMFASSYKLSSLAPSTISVVRTSFSGFEETFMNLALRQAQAAFRANEIPIGAVIVDYDGVVVSACRNSVERNNDSTCHAEIQCIRAASKIKKNWRLENCTLYTTLEPCDMCMGAIMSARIARCVYAASDNKIGFTRHTMEDKVIYKNPFHSVIIKSGLLENESKSLLRNFFQSRRKIKPENDQAHSNDSYSREVL